MNLRTLKKLSKLAAPILIQHFGRPSSEMFMAKRHDNYHGLVIRCSHKQGRFGCGCDTYPLKGTPMFGAVRGYYEPEWDERTAWDELSEAVYWEGRPASMTDPEWERCKRIARTVPVTDEDMDAWVNDSMEAIDAFEAERDGSDLQPPKKD